MTWRYPPAWPNDGDRVLVCAVTGEWFTGLWEVHPDGQLLNGDLLFVHDIDVLCWAYPYMPDSPAGTQLSLDAD